MEKPFRFRHVNEIAGAFVIVAAVLLALGIILSGQVQGWFQATRIYRVVLPDAGTMGIKPGSEVKILGSRAGSVERIELRHKETEERLYDVSSIDPERVDLVAVMRVRSDRVVFVGLDSQAILRYDLGGFGAPFFEISRGVIPRKKSDELLELKLEKDVKDGLTLQVENIGQALIPAIRQIEQTSEKIGGLADNLSNPEGDFQQALSAINRVTGRVNRSEGVAGVLINDDDAAQQLRDTLANFAAASSEIGQSVAALNSLLSGLEKGEGAAGALFNDQKLADQLRRTIGEVEIASREINKSLTALPPMLNSTNSAVGEFTEAARVMQDALKEYEILGEALQRHWLVRKQVDKVEAEQEDAPTSTASKSSTPKKTVKQSSGNSSPDRPASSGLRLPFQRKR